ncbi:hypothetical protein SBA3_240001 [Candidatus Sulfopaludibacter sp. SbA3]|nr:hypothetical protein SBA3_240001 [Candidatus Sulfopaludibacter sp. SbA3]
MAEYVRQASRRIDIESRSHAFDKFILTPYRRDGCPWRTGEEPHGRVTRDRSKCSGRISRPLGRMDGSGLL